MSTILAKKISFAYTLQIMNNIEQKYAEFILNEELRIEGGEKLGMRGIVFDSYEGAKVKLEKMLNE